MIKTTFGDECMVNTQPEDWYKQFKDGCTSDSDPSLWAACDGKNK